MAFLNKHGSIATKSELDLFTVPPTQISIDGGQNNIYRPVSTVTENAPIEFFVTASGSEYFDPSHTQLYVLVKVVKADGTNLAAADNVAPVNNWLHSMFSEVDITLNHKNITSASNLYYYRAYIENLLSYGKKS